MTEILEKIEGRMRERAEKRAAQPRYIIDPVAFFLALVGGPLIMTLVSCWMIIPIFALFLGAPAYLIMGTPILLLYLRRNEGNTGDIAFLAFCTNLLLLPIGLVLEWAGDPWDMVDGAAGYIAFGMIFAPFWGAGFGILYNRLRRDFYTQPQYI